MKTGEIWESKDKYREKIKINYIEHYEEGDYIGYTYLKEPICVFAEKTEEMIAHSYFIANFRKCHL